MSHPDDQERVSIERVQASAADEGLPVASVKLLPRHGSTRRYARVELADGTRRIAMILPLDAAESAEVGVSPADSMGGSSFVLVQQCFASHGVPVPRIHGIDEERQILWLDDLGPVDLDMAQRAAPSARERLYERAIDLLIGIQSIGLADAPPVIRDRTFSVDHFQWELEHYVEWRLERRLGVRLGEAERAALSTEFRTISERLSAMPAVVSHRDFQSHNLMVDAHGGLTAIDFQDALMAPAVYDLVALLRDSYVELSAAEVDRALESWFAAASDTILDATWSAETVRSWFHLQTIQRKLKDAGRFEYFALHDSNEAFLQYLPASVRYVREALQQMEEFPTLREILVAREPFYVAASTSLPSSAETERPENGAESR